MIRLIIPLVVLSIALWLAMFFTPKKLKTQYKSQMWKIVFSIVGAGAILTLISITSYVLEHING